MQNDHGCWLKVGQLLFLVIDAIWMDAVALIAHVSMHVVAGSHDDFETLVAGVILLTVDL